jgi:hypothetical protein
MSNQKKLRDLERLLRKKQASNEDCDLLLKKIDEVKSIKETAKLNERSRKYAKKYHLIKFVERKKITRNIRSIETKIKSEKPSKEISKELKRLKEDLAYIMFVFLLKYFIVLF